MTNNWRTYRLCTQGDGTNRGEQAKQRKDPLHGEETTIAETKVQHFPCDLTMSLNGDLKGIKFTGERGSQT
jgi:hypothetical protein